MKKRRGLVSNSSSSSFIVAFPRVPETVEEMRELLFGEDTEYPSPFKYHGERSYPAETVAKTVFGDIGHAREMSPTLIEIAVREGYAIESEELELCLYIVRKWMNETTDWMWEDYMDKVEKCEEEYYFPQVKKYVKRFVEDTDGFVYLRFRYSDQGGDYFSALEHGDLFKRLKHIKISEH